MLVTSPSPILIQRIILLRDPQGPENAYVRRMDVGGSFSNIDFEPTRWVYKPWEIKKRLNEKNERNL